MLWRKRTANGFWSEHSKILVDMKGLSLAVWAEICHNTLKATLYSKFTFTAAYLLCLVMVVALYSHINTKMKLLRRTEMLAAFALKFMEHEISSI